jgi:beta-N-acetylhexosaminidase
VTLEQKIGQMILTGFRGLTVDANSPVVDDIRSRRVSGVILFDKDVALNSDIRNIESPTQVKELNKKLQEYGNGNLIISVDQEGGLITRLKEKYGFRPTASHQEIGNRDEKAFTVEQVRQTAETLATAGFNMNFAPVVDLNLNPQNPVIGSFERSFSDNVDTVVKHAVTYIDELHRKGILSALKHFPGHGSSTGDSHEGFVDVTNIWQLKELSSFRDLIEIGKTDVIMTAHIFNSNYDKKYPATLSRGWLTGILRYGLEFDGVIITDDMQMKAISKHFNLVESVELAINAGADILMFANNVDFDEDIARKVNDIILELVKDKRIPEERIEEAYQRISTLKSKINN